VANADFKTLSDGKISLVENDEPEKPDKPIVLIRYDTKRYGKIAFPHANEMRYDKYVQMMGRAKILMYEMSEEINVPYKSQLLKQ